MAICSNLHNENIEIKSWVFANENEVDIEIWRDDNYVTTLTINTLSGAVIHHALAAHLEEC